mmetsp:Transcript_8268/g.12680  ORF Transcript_8268/g.12680 Transcript_8268/m.12680 type:complete len:459 (-) Transcript_8268:141-1517(-)|eukprot:CAMPEP_0195285006 /NCGR_PEP_ID=MMETSP0707-20130614/2998_1 /TAXON_ID=33640 /ORGANISM="Asterionellopsis glacialis, Strain CCMP134" /LENGTH=458 /DNA_ID=CAMNT_0040344435 /DNA_START=123 /DNA_END=1499 /DNA_ORIENTATION=+
MKFLNANTVVLASLAFNLSSAVKSRSRRLRTNEAGTRRVQAVLESDKEQIEYVLNLESDILIQRMLTGSSFDEQGADEQGTDTISHTPGSAPGGDNTGSTPTDGTDDSRSPDDTPSDTPADDSGIDDPSVYPPLPPPGQDDETATDRESDPVPAPVPAVPVPVPAVPVPAPVPGSFTWLFPTAEPTGTSSPTVDCSANERGSFGVTTGNGVDLQYAFEVDVKDSVDVSAVETEIIAALESIFNDVVIADLFPSCGDNVFRGPGYSPPLTGISSKPTDSVIAGARCKRITNPSRCLVVSGEMTLYIPGGMRVTFAKETVLESLEAHMEKGTIASLNAAVEEVAYVDFSSISDYSSIGGTGGTGDTGGAPDVVPELVTDETDPSSNTNNDNGDGGATDLGDDGGKLGGSDDNDSNALAYGLVGGAAALIVLGVGGFVCKRHIGDDNQDFSHMGSSSSYTV